MHCCRNIYQPDDDNGWHYWQDNNGMPMIINPSNNNPMRLCMMLTFAPAGTSMNPMMTTGGTTGKTTMVCPWLSERSTLAIAVTVPAPAIAVGPARAAALAATIVIA